MPAFDFTCGKCGFVAQYVGSGKQGRTSFDISYVLLCEEAKAAKERGENPLNVDCPHLNRALGFALSRHR